MCECKREISHGNDSGRKDLDLVVKSGGWGGGFANGDSHLYLHPGRENSVTNAQKASQYGNV